jgi:hypothetical protein
MGRPGQHLSRGVVLLTPAVGLEQLPPGQDLRPALEQRPTPAFRHTAPDPESDLAVQGVGEAFDNYRAAGADLLGGTRTNRASGSALLQALLGPVLHPRATSCCCYTLAMRHGDGHVGPPTRVRHCARLFGLFWLSPDSRSRSSHDCPLTRQQQLFDEEPPVPPDEVALARTCGSAAMGMGCVLVR